MSDKRHWSIKGLFMVALVVAGLSVYAGCGEVGSSNMPVTAMPSSAIVSLEAIGPRGATSTSEGSENLVIRANSRDLLVVIANVTGVTRELGFFIAQGITSIGWGTWQGGVLNTADGFTYYPVDDVGEARGVLVAGSSAGRQDIIARYQDWDTGGYLEARLSITFDMGTISIFPSTIVLNNEPFLRKVVEVRGALAPIEWWVSHPDIMVFTIRDEYSIFLSWKDPLNPIGGTTLPAGGGIVTARDAEGQEVEAIVFMINTACSTGVLSVGPLSGPFGGTTVSVEVTDLDLIGVTSIEVQAKAGLTLDGATTVTLISDGDDGYFYGSFTAVAPSVGEYWLTYKDEQNAANQCLGSSISALYIAN